MTDYNTRPFEQTGDSYYAYYKLYVDERCHYDEYVESIENDLRRKESLSSIIAYMEQLSPQIMLPKSKFRHIEDTGRKDTFEFKKDNVRVYVIKQPPNIFVVIAGDKDEQKKTIAKFKRLVRDFPETYNEKNEQE